MSAPSPVLERNLERLFTRSYRPVRMREEFRSRLIREVGAVTVERGRELAPGFQWPAVAAAAAVFVLALGALSTWLAWPRPSRSPSHEEQLAAAGALVREGPASPWHAPESADRIAIATPWLEVRTSATRRLEIDSEAGALRLAPDSSVTFDRAAPSAGGGSVLRATLGSGAIESLGALQERDFHLRAADCELRLRGAVFALAWLGPEASAAETALVEGVDAMQPLARLLASGGEIAWLPAPLEPTGERLGYLQDGRFFTASAAAIPVEHGAREEETVGAATPAVETGPDGWTVRGRLVDPDGVPLAGRARVWHRAIVPLPKVAQPELVLIDDATRGFVLTGTESGQRLVHVEAAGFAAWRSALLELAPGSDVEIDVTLQSGATVEGFVLDAASGMPLPGALVVAERDVPQQVLALDGSLDESIGGELPVAFAHADSRGVFLLAHLSPGKHVLRAGSPTHAASWVSVEAVEGVTTRAPDLALRAGAGLRGTVRREDGSAWSGAEIVAAKIDLVGITHCISFGFTLTNDFGEYSIQHLPPGLYAVMNESEQPNTEPEWQRLEQVVLREGDSKTLDFNAGATGRVVRGRLVDSAGVAIADATLYLFAGPCGDRWEGWTATQSGDDGRFEFVDVQPALHGLYLASGLGEGMRLLTLVDATPRGDIELDVSPPATRITGRLRAASDGRALPRTLAILLRQEAGQDEWCFAGKTGGDASGSFVLAGVPAGRYLLLAYDLDEHCAQHVTEPFTLHVGEPVSFDLELEDGGSVVVRVVDAAGRPVSDARVWSEHDGTEAALFDPDGQTNEDGTIRLGALSPRLWVIHAEREAHAAGTESLQVRAGEEHVVTVRLKER